MRPKRFLALLLTAALWSPAVRALDSTSSPHPAIGWQAPNARALSGAPNCSPGTLLNWTGTSWACVGYIDQSGETAAASYATNSGEVGGHVMPAACSYSYVLTATGAGWQCVSSVAHADAATAANTATTANDGVASVVGHVIITYGGTQYTVP